MYKTSVVIAIGASLIIVSASAAFADANPPPPPATYPVFAYVVVGIVAVGTVIGLGTIRSALSGSPWSLSDALSEEVNVTPMKPDGTPLLGTDNKPLIVSEMKASSSRLIALLGLVSILMIYLGFGLVLIERLASDAALPTNDQISEILKFLLAGLTMFAPYLVNKFSSTFDWLTPKKP